MGGGLDSDSWNDYNVHEHQYNLLPQDYDSPDPAAVIT